MWIESNSYNFQGNFNRNIFEAQIVEANSSSAYAVDLQNLEEDKPFKFRISQKSHKMMTRGAGFGHSYIFWESKEDFEAVVQYEADVDKYKKLLNQQIKECHDLGKLKKLVGILSEK